MKGKEIERREKEKALEGQEKERREKEKALKDAASLRRRIREIQQPGFNGGSTSTQV